MAHIKVYVSVSITHIDCENLWFATQLRCVDFLLNCIRISLELCLKQQDQFNGAGALSLLYSEIIRHKNSRYKFKIAIRCQLALKTMIPWAVGYSAGNS